MAKRFLALLLSLILALTVFSITASAAGDPEEPSPVCYAMIKGNDEPYYDGDTAALSPDEEIFVSFHLDPPAEGLIAGWRTDLLKEAGFEIDDDDTACAHIKTTGMLTGTSGTLYYNFYRIEDIFGENAVGWKDAVPVYSASLILTIENILGDTDRDGVVTVLDATAIQRRLAALPTKEFSLRCADADRDGEIGILDATAIQRFIAGMTAYAEIGGALNYGTYFASWNVRQELLPEGSELTGAEAERAREEIRRAMNLLVDRGWIVRNLFNEGIVRLPASTFVSKWVSDADGSEFHQNAGLGGGVGYFKADSYEENFNSAVEILKKYYQYDEASGKFTDVPALSYIYNVSGAHETIANKIRNDFAAVGISMTITGVGWNDYVEIVRDHNCSIARSGWVIDNDDPLEFLELFTTDNPDQTVGFDNDAKCYDLDLNEYGIDYKIENGTWGETYDVLIERIRACEDRELAYRLMHKAEDMLMDTGCVMPLYYY